MTKTHSELTRAGLKRAKARGVWIGRPRALKYPARTVIARAISAGTLTVREAAKMFNIGETTVRRYVKESRKEPT